MGRWRDEAVRRDGKGRIGPARIWIVAVERGVYAMYSEEQQEEEEYREKGDIGEVDAALSSERYGLGQCDLHRLTMGRPPRVHSGSTMMV